jgi:hypothetical protein
MHERIQARRAEIKSVGPDSYEESRRHLVSALDELTAALENLATLPGHRFAGVYVAAVCELRSIAERLSFSSPDDAVEWGSVAATVASLHLAIAVSAESVRRRR